MLGVQLSPRVTRGNVGNSSRTHQALSCPQRINFVPRFVQ